MAFYYFSSAREWINGISRFLSASTEENRIDIAVGGVRVAFSLEIRFDRGNLTLPYSWQYQ
jgi:hypothetical protein